MKTVAGTVHAVWMTTVLVTVSNKSDSLAMSTSGDDPTADQVCCQELDMLRKVLPKIRNRCTPEDCTQWLRDMRTTNTSNSTSCPVTEDVLCEKFDSLEMLNQTRMVQSSDWAVYGHTTVGNILSVVDAAFWRSCIVIYDADAWPAVLSLSSQLSERQTQVILHDMSASRVSQASGAVAMLGEVLGRLAVRNVIVMAPLADVELLFREAERFDKHLGRKSGLRMYTQWVVVTSSGLEEQLEAITSYFDNVVAIFEEPQIITQASSQNNITIECVATEISTLMYVASPTEHSHHRREFQSVTEFVPAVRHLAVVEPVPNVRHGFNQRSLLVGTKEWPPFVVKKLDSSGRPHYSGISMDLLRELAQVLNFTSVLVEPPSGEGWGRQNQSGHWEGLVGLLDRQEVDVVVSSLHFTEDRVLAMDATLPFYTAYLAAVFRKPDPAENKWRIYLRPFQEEVLLCLGISLVAMTCLVHVMSWLDPASGDKAEEDKEVKEKEKDEKKDKEDDRKKKEKDKRTNFPGPAPDDGFWYMFGALLSQGGLYLPSSSSSRVLVSSWWLFCMVIGAAYSGNLIAFLTVQLHDKPFTSLTEMLQQQSEGYRWGVVEKTSQHTLLKESKDPTLRGLWQKLEEFAASDPDVLNMDPAVQKAKVRSGGYVHITDSVTTEAWTRENCDLDQVVDLETVSLPVAVYLPKGSQLTRLFNEYVMRSVEAGLVIKGKRDHFINHLLCTQSHITDSPEITFPDVQSVLYASVLGVGLALLALLFEVLCHRRPKLCFWSSKMNLKQEVKEACKANDLGASRIPRYSVVEDKKPRNCFDSKAGSPCVGDVGDEPSVFTGDEKSPSGMCVACYNSVDGKEEDLVGSKKAVVFYIGCREAEISFSGKFIPGYSNSVNEKEKNDSTVSRGAVPTSDELRGEVNSYL